MKFSIKHTDEMNIATDILATIFPFFILVLSLGFNWYFQIMEMQYEFILYGFISVFFASLAAFLIMVLSVMRRQRNHWLLLLFTPLLAWSPIFFSLYHYERYELYSDVVSNLYYLLCLPWIIGLIILWSKGRKKENSISTNRLRFSGVVLKKIVPSAMIISLFLSVVVSGFSCYRMNTGTYTVTEEPHYGSFLYSGNVSVDTFSIELPNYYKNYTYWYHSWHDGDPELLYIYERSNILGDFSWLTISIFPSRLDKYKEMFPSVIRGCIYAYDEVSEFNSREYFVKDLEISNITVNSIEAEYAAYEIWDFNGFHEPGMFFRSVQMICFEYNDDIWVIRSEGDRNINSVDLISLIQTLEITG